MDFGNNCTVELLPDDVPIKDRVQQKVDLADVQEKDVPIFIADLGDIIHKYRKWHRNLPSVKPFYAVKSNDDYAVLKVLAALGVNFDCASQAEIEKVLSLGVSPDRIVYAHTCKHASMLKYAAKNHVNITTFDNENELYKIKKIHPTAKIIIRIRPSEQFKVKRQLGTKFGCDEHDVLHLLKTAISLGLQVVGVSFHVGYLCQDARAYEDAIRKAREVFATGQELGINMYLLDMGGGYPGKNLAEGTPFEEIATSIKKSLTNYFHDVKDITVIAEPGEFFSASAFTLATKIIASRRDVVEMSDDTTHHGNQGKTIRYMYYLNDGMYGSFCGIMGFGNIHPYQLKQESDKCKVYESTLWGPTCDSVDEIFSSVKLFKHEVGEWLYFPNMGSYTVPVHSRFNGMPSPEIYYTCFVETWQKAFPEAE